jgi:cell division protein FtsL
MSVIKATPTIGISLLLIALAFVTMQNWNKLFIYKNDSLNTNIDDVDIELPLMDYDDSAISVCIGCGRSRKF